MIICLPADSNSENSTVSSSFGRCPFYAFYDVEKDEFEIVPNPASNSMSGAGIQAAGFVVNKGAKVLLTVNVGPNSGEVLKSAGVKIITGAKGTLREAVEKFSKGVLHENGDVVFSEPKHEHKAPEDKNPDLSTEIKNISEAINVLSKRTEKLLEKVEKLSKE